MLCASQRSSSFDRPRSNLSRVWDSNFLLHKGHIYQVDRGWYYRRILMYIGDYHYPWWEKNMKHPVKLNEDFDHGPIGNLAKFLPMRPICLQNAGEVPGDGSRCDAKCSINFQLYGYYWSNIFQSYFSLLLLIDPIFSIYFPNLTQTRNKCKCRRDVQRMKQNYAYVVHRFNTQTVSLSKQKDSLRHPSQ